MPIKSVIVNKTSIYQKMIIVTGATGHIGNVLVRKLLAQGETVGIVSRSRRQEQALAGLQYTLFEGDLSDVDFLTRTFAQAQQVYHLAGLISILPNQLTELTQTNIVGTQNVLTACRASGVQRLVYTSSTHTFRELPHGTALTEVVEDDLTKVDGDYAVTKIKATQAVFEAARAGLNVVVVFPSGVTGPFDFKPSEMGGRIQQFLRGWLPFRVEGAYNFVDVRDVANGLIAAMQHGVSGEGYCLCGYSVTVRALFEAAAAAQGKGRRTFAIPYSVAYLSAQVLEVFAKTFSFAPTFTTYALRVLRSNSDISFAKAHQAFGYSPRPITTAITDYVRWVEGKPVSLE